MKPFNEAFDINKFHCHPRIAKEQQPFNAADSYLYTYLVENDILFEGAKVAILNDETGILSYLLRDYSPTSISDSFFAKTALEENFKSSGADSSSLTFVDSIAFTTLETTFDIVLMKVPKSLRYFTEQLGILRGLMHDTSVLVTSAMVKHLSKNCREVLTTQIGETNIHRVVKKAILFDSTKSVTKAQPKLISRFTLPQYGTFQSYSNTFSVGKLDRGTALLLENLPKDIEGTVVDLGCGYGIIAKELLARYPGLDLYGVDASRMAVESTKLNVEGCKVIWGDGLSFFDDGAIDYVITNPPFHHDNHFSVKMGIRLFKQVHRKLKEGGTCIMVANSGLNYGPFLKGLFYRTKAIGRNNNYTVFLLTK